MAAAPKLKLYRRDERRDEEDIQQLLSRFQSLLSIQRLWAVEWQEIADYVLPRKNSIIIQRIPGSKRTQRLFDSTALDARHKLSAAMHGALTSSYVRWFYLETDDDDLNADQATGIWLDRTAELMLRFINRSNFAAEAGELYTDLVTFASSCMFCEEQPRKNGVFQGFRFRTEQIGRFVWSEGPDGMVNTLFREVPMSRDAVKRKWPDTPEEFIQSENPASKDELIYVVHGVEPEEDEWRSVYFLNNGKYKLSEKKFDQFPFFCPRWSKASGETYGRGPTHDAIPDIRSLNKIVEMQLRALPKLVDPPLLAAQGDVIGPARLTPGGVTTVRSGNPREAVVPLMSGIDLRQVGISVDRLDSHIRSIYHESELQMPNGPQMTAEEVRARREQMLMLLGPTVYGHIESEFLKPCVDFLFTCLRKANLLPPLPPAMQQALQNSSLSLRIKYDGPIARAQRASDNDAMTRLVQFVMPVIQADPAALDVIDTDEMVRTAGQKFGVPPQVLRDKDGVDKVRAVKEQQVAAQQQQAQMANTAQAAGNAAPMVKALHTAPEQGSVAGQLQNAGQPNPA